MKQPIVAITLVSLGCAASAPRSAAPDLDSGNLVQVESLKRRGGRPLTGSFRLDEPDTPYPGVLLYSNQNAVTTTLDFAQPGRYRFRIRGASSNERPAGISVFVAGQPRATGWFYGREPSTIELLVDVPASGALAVELGLTTDIGENDTLLDSFTWSRAAPLMPGPMPPVDGAARTGVYRNLLVERGYPAEAVEQRVAGVFQQLFHGDQREETVYYETGSNESGPLAYVTDVGSDDVRSEGMSYGMMVAVQLDKKAEFDALWNWATTYMLHKDPRHPVAGYFAWSMNKDGTPRDDMPAPDGEEYFATALYFASARWGDGKGLRDYRKQATDLVDRIKNRRDVSGKVRNGRTVTSGALFNSDHKQVRFTPDRAYFVSDGDHTDPSYHVPAFYELWARWGPVADRTFWTQAAGISRDLFVKAAHPVTGLVPDYAEFDGRPKARSSDPGSATFRYDAWRAAMNWSVDHSWWAADKRQQALSDRLQAFFLGAGIATHGNTFTLDGKQTGKDHSAGLVAMNAVASLAATTPDAWLFIDQLWAVQTPRGKWRYYDGMLYLMALLHTSGHFRIWDLPDAAKIGDRL